MNFNVIGGGGGGPFVTSGATLMSGVPRPGDAATGGGFGLNRNRLRSTSMGFGRSPFSVSRWTSGAVIPPAPFWRAAGGTLAGLDDGERAGDVATAR